MMFWPTAWENCCHWQRYNARMPGKPNGLVQRCRRHPFKGTSKPGPMSGNPSGWRSRRINQGHRMVHRLDGKEDDQTRQVAKWP